MLVTAGAVQATTFAFACGVLAALAPLGTSRVGVLPALLAGFLLFAAGGGSALVRHSALGEQLADRFAPPGGPVAGRGP